MNIRRGRLVRGLGAAVAVAVVVAIPLAFAGTASGDSPDHVAVRAALDDVFGAGSFAASDVAHGAISASAAAAAHQDVVTRLSSHMTGAALNHWTTALGTSVEAQAAGGQLVGVGGGIDQIKFDPESQAGEITGYAHTWSQWIMPGSGQTGHPEEWIQFDCHVVLTPDGWRVDELHYEPGSFDQNGNWAVGGG